MSSVLEKKMAFNTRLPPSLLSYDDYWDALEAHVSKWMLDTLNVEGSAKIDLRKNIDGKLASELIVEKNGYLIGDTMATLPSSIWFSQSISTRYAAERLGDKPERLTGTSPVFLRLICEAPTSEFLFKLSDWLTVSTLANKLGDPSEVSYGAEPIDQTCRYVQVEIIMHVDDESYEIGFLINLDRFLELHAERVRMIRSGNGSLSTSSETLRRSVRTSFMDVDAIIERLDMTIADCSRLVVGQELSLPDAKRHTIKLVAHTLTGKEDIAQGELGVWKQNRALKLTTPVTDSFLRNTVDL